MVFTQGANEILFCNIEDFDSSKEYELCIKTKIDCKNKKTVPLTFVFKNCGCKNCACFFFELGDDCIKSGWWSYEIKNENEVVSSGDFYVN